MVDPTTLKEFAGRFVISYKDGETIYAYDDNTHGLFQFTLGFRMVEMVIYPTEIIRDIRNRIMGIVKKGNEIILIPRFVDKSWVFYDIKERKIRYEAVVENKLQISGVVMVGADLFFIPDYPLDPIAIFSLKEMKITKIFRCWYDGKEDRPESVSGTTNVTYIWGAFSYDDQVFFPIVNTRKIVSVNHNEVRIITANIPYPIFSVYIQRDRIWILPVTGKYLFTVDFKGEINGRIDLGKDPDISASRFYRIIAIEEDIFLLPMYEENIYVYQCKKKQIVQIEAKGSNMWGRLFASLAVSYADFVVENRTLHLLPCDCQYKKIHIDTLESEESRLYFKDYIDCEKYWKRVGDVQKKYMIEKGKNDLKDFYQLIFYVQANDSQTENKMLGKQIWENIGGNRNIL